jgi:type II secretory pathway component PulF
MKANLKDLEEFSYSMVKCLSSGIQVARSLELSGSSSESRALRRCVRHAIVKVKDGATIWEALAFNEKIFPHFFVPVVRCGEESGRLVEAFEYLCDYCHKLRPAAKIIRQTWLYPIVLIVFGWLVRSMLYLIFDSPGTAWQFAQGTFVKFGIIAAIIYVVLKLRPARVLFDWIKLQLPLLRETQIDFSIDIFFRTLNLVYKTGGIHIARMVEMASLTIANSLIKKDFLRARQPLLDGEPIAESFSRQRLVPQVYKDEIAVGAVSGELARCLNKICEISSRMLEMRLKIFNNIFLRIISYAVAMSIVFTVLALTM